MLIIILVILIVDVLIILIKILLIKKGICENTEYTIKEIHNFGGGCPAILLEIEELPNTHSFNDAVGANWFMPYTKTE